MVRAERIGLGVATVGHVLLFLVLSLGIVSTARLPPPKSEAIDVQLVDLIGLRSAAPEAEPKPPAAAEAPDEGAPEEAAPPAAAPEPQPAPPPPEPEPAPPPQPAPPKPAPKPAPPKPATEKPAPKPTPALQPDRRAEARAAAAKAAAARAAAAEAAAEKVAAEKAAARTAAAAKAKADRAAALKAAVAAAAREAKGDGEKGAKARATGPRLGPDFLKGIKAEKSTGKSAAPAAAAVSDRAMAGLGAAIKRQVQPCYELGALGGTSATQIITTLRLKINRDGSVRSAALEEQAGLNSSNQSYARQMVDVSRRAVLRCAPLRLPPDLYDKGWEDIILDFKPDQMQ